MLYLRFNIIHKMVTKMVKAMIKSILPLQSYRSMKKILIYKDNLVGVCFTRFVTKTLIILKLLYFVIYTLIARISSKFIRCDFLFL